jgi:hypothetical protein
MMADATEVHIGENSPEQVAFKLLHEIALAEDKQMFGDRQTTDHTHKQKPDRKWILSTYAECLKAVKQRNPS